MLDILITILEFAAGWYVGGLIYSLIKRLIVGKDKEIEAEVEAEAIIQMPKLRLESVPTRIKPCICSISCPVSFSAKV